MADQAPALVMCFHWGQLPPPWFVPAEAPACGAVADVPAEATNDGIARRFVCDQRAGHETFGALLPGEQRNRHRQVTDSDTGEAITWPVEEADVEN